MRRTGDGGGSQNVDPKRRSVTEPVPFSDSGHSTALWNDQSGQLIREGQTARAPGCIVSHGNINKPCLG